MREKLRNGTGGVRSPLSTAWNVFVRMENYYNINEFIGKPKKTSWGKPSKAIHPCYRKEARAMLAGLHWQGKNKCVKLPGDA